MAMTFRLEITPDLEAKLRARAAAAGKDPATFALELLAERLRAPRSFAEILAPAHEAVRESGMTDAEIDAFVDKAIADARRAPRSTPRSTTTREATGGPGHRT
jgi:hypothetical protein